MNANTSLLVNAGNGPSQIISLSSGKPIKIKIQSGTKYLLKNHDNNFAPENVTLQRNGDDLLVILEGDSEPAIVIDNYYVSGNNEPLLGMAEDGQLYAYTVTDASSLGEGYQFSDGVTAPAALGGSSYGDGAYLFENTDDNDKGLLAFWPWFLGAAVVGGGIIGKVIHDHNDNDHHDSSPTETPDEASNPTLGGALDTTGKIQGEITYGSATDEKTPTIYGTGDAGNTITIYDNGKAIGSVVVGDDGDWQFKPDTPLSDGDHEITVTQTTPEGSTSSQSDDLTFTVDTVAPNKPMFSDILDDVGLVQGPIANGATTDDPRLEFTGKGEAGNTITIYVNGDEVGTTTVGSDGKWSYTPETDLADGHYQVTVTETDKAGNTSEHSPTFDFDLDTTIPTARITHAVDDETGLTRGAPSLQPHEKMINHGETTRDTTPRIHGESSGAKSVALYMDGKFIANVVVDNEGYWSYTPTAAWGDGQHTFHAIATNAAGNVSEKSADFIITLDSRTAAPVIDSVIDDQAGGIVGNIPRDGLTNDNTPKLTGSAEAGSIVTIYDNGKAIGSTTADSKGAWSFTTPVLSDDSHHFTARAVDPAGNRSPESAAYSVTVDTIAPDAPVISSVAGQTGNHGLSNDTMPTLAGLAEKGSLVQIYDNGKLLGSAVADNNGQWTFKPTTPIAEGDHQFHATATDAAGNTSQPSTDFTLTSDFTPSSVPVITGVDDQVGTITGNVKSGDTTDDSRPTISGTGTAGDTIILYTKDNAGNHEIGRALVDNNGTWSLRPDIPLAKGNNEFTAIEVDPAGNKTDPSNSYLIIFDNGKPQAPVIESVFDDVPLIMGELQKDAITNDNTPTINGSAESNVTVNIYDNGIKIGSTQVDSQGNWSFTPSTPLGDGKHSITADAVNAVGQTSDKTGGFNFTVDTAAPDAVDNLTIFDDVGAVTGVLHNGDTTDDNKPTFSGKAEADSTVTIYNNGTAIGSAKADSHGDWSFTPNNPLADGEYHFSTTVTDQAGNTSTASPEVTITINTENVTVTLDTVNDDVGDITGSVSQNGVTDDTRPELIGSGKVGSIITIYDGNTVLGTAIVQADKSWHFTPSSDLLEGQHSITVTAKDLAGNTSNPTAPFVFTVDTTAPTQPAIESAYDDVGSVQGILTSGAFSDDPTPTLSGIAEANSIVKIYDAVGLLGSVTTGSDGRWSYTPTTPLPEGQHQFHVTATDKAGNVSQPSNDFILTLDFTAPDYSKLAITGVDDQVGLVTGNVKSGETTDDSRPTISGTGTAGDTIILYTNDSSGNHEIGRTIVDGSGHWSLQPTSPLAKGSNDFTAVEVDPVGNATAPSHDYLIILDPEKPQPPVIDMVFDDVAPITGALQKDAITDDNTPTISGTAGANLTVNIYDNGVKIGSTQADSQGNWSFTPSTPLSDGKHSITADAVNAVGQTSDKTGGFNFTVDTVAPSAVDNLTIFDDVGAVTGALHNGDTTDDNKPTFSGEAEADSTVTIYNNGTAIGSAKADSHGDWSFTPNNPLADGEYHFSTNVTDVAGNSSAASPEVTITINTENVTVTLDTVNDDVGDITGSVSQNGVTDDTRPEMIGTGKVGSTITIYDGNTVLGTAIVQADKSWHFTPSSDLLEGQHSITVTAKDLAGNTSSPTAPFIFTVDTTAPTQPTIESAYDDVGSVQGNLFNGAFSDDPTPTLSGTAEANSIVKIYDAVGLLGSVTTGSDGRWSYTPTTPLPEGQHQFHVIATDKAGNISQPSNDFILTLDFTAPDYSKLAITGVDDQVGLVTGNVKSGETTDDSRPTISGTGTAGDTIILYTNDSSGNHEIGRTIVDGSGHWSLQPTSPLAKGSNDFTAVEVDPVGNATAPSHDYLIILDPEKPQPPVIDMVFDDVVPITGALQKDAITDDNTPTISGTAGANLTVNIYDNGVKIGSTHADSQGNWSFTPSTPLSDGKHSITADAVNAVGQTSDKTGGFNFTVDTAAPDAVDNLTIFDDVGAVTGALHNNDTTDDNKPTFSGKAEADSTVTIYNNGTAIGSAKADSHGDWSFTPNNPLADGEYHFSTKVTDVAGNSSAASPEVTITINTENVTVTLDTVNDDVGDITGSVSQNGVTDDTRPELIGTGKVGSIITIYDGNTVLGTAIVQADKSWHFTPSSDLLEGQHSITVTAKDLAGNTSNPTAPFIFTVDTTVPTQPTIESAYDDVGSVQGILANGAFSDDPTPTLSGIAEANSIVKIYDAVGLLGSVTTGSDGRWSYTPTTPLPEGQHQFHVTATDKAGNVSQPSNDFILTLDFTAPDYSKLAITGVDDQVGLVTGNVKSGEITDDSRPTISGTGTAGDTIILYTNDSSGNHEIGRTIVDGSGHWSLQPTSPLAKGSNDFTAVEVDPVGNATAPSHDYLIILDPEKPQPPVIDSVFDDVAPITGALQKDAITDDNTPTISGTAGANLTVNIYDNGVKIGSTHADSQGNWSFTPSTPLSDGKHSITADAVNAVGQTSDKTGGFNFTVDTAAPDAVDNLTIFDDVGAVTGALHNGDTTDDNKPTFSGKAEADSTVTIYNNGTAIGSAKVDSHGDWSFTPNNPLADGEYHFSTKVTDVAGNTSVASPEVTITINTENVTVTLDSVNDDVGDITGSVSQNGVTDDMRPEMIGTGKVGSTISIYDNGILIGSAVVQADKSWHFTPSSDLLEGQHSITVTAKDLAGNTSNPTAPFVFTVDTTAPTQPTIESAYDDVGSVQGILANGAFSDDPTPTLSGTAEANSIVKIYDAVGLLGSVTTGSDGRWSYTPTTPLPEGEHLFHVTATDKAGNVSQPSNDFILNLDFSAPNPVQDIKIIDDVGAVTGELKDGDTTDDNTPTFSGKAEAGGIVTIYDDGKALGSVVADGHGDWSYTPAALPDGDYKFTTTVTDAAGNTSAATPAVNITVETGSLTVAIDRLLDDVAPVTGDIPQNGYTNDLRPEIIGSSSKGNSTITVCIDGVDVGTTTTNADGSWRFTPTADLSQGEHKVTVTATDKTGTQAHSPEFIFHVDSIAPTLPTIDKAIDDVGEITGDLHNGSVTDDTTPTLIGTAEQGSTVNIYEKGGALIGTAMADNSGNWRYELPVQSEGHHDYYVTASDQAGNVSAPTPDFGLDIDITPPPSPPFGNLKIEHVIDNVGDHTGELTSGDSTDDNRPELQGTANEVGSTVIIYATDSSGVSHEVGRALVDSHYQWHLELANALADGEYKFSVIEMDAAGNKSQPTPDFLLTIDTLMPTATATIDNMTDDVGPVTGNFNSGVYTDDSTPTLNGSINGTLRANDVVKIYEKDTSGNLHELGIASLVSGSDRWVFDVPPASLIGGNEHTYVAAVTSSSGNYSTPSSEFTLTSVIEINRNSTQDTTPLITGRLPYELDADSYLSVTINGRTYTSLSGDVVVDKNTLTWSLQIPDQYALPVNTYDVDARIDSAKGGTRDMTTGELTIEKTPGSGEFNVTPGDANNKAVAYTMNNQGNWQLFVHQSVMNSHGTTTGDFDSTTLTPNTGGTGYGTNNLNMVQNATFVDFNRDGHMDIMGIDSRWSNGEQIFINNGDGTYTAKQLDGTAWFGGIAAIDLKGDGYIDLLMGSQAADQGNKSSPQILLNDGGVFTKSNWFTSYNAGFDQEVSGVDLDNDGAVDVVYHATDGSNAVDNYGGSSSDPSRLVVAKNDGTGHLRISQIVSDAFFYMGSVTNSVEEPSMTWADFNGDGYMDLFLSTTGTTPLNSDKSVIYFNDGHGNLLSTNPTGVGTVATSKNYLFDDHVIGGASVAVDWNGDGKMDIIEAPHINGYDVSGVEDASPVNLYINTTSGKTVHFTTNYLQQDSTFGSNEKTAMKFQGFGHPDGRYDKTIITGMVSLDLDYDGAKDLLIFTASGKTVYTHNDNKIADGTSLHLRIVDPQGISIFYGNTVQLVDSHGNVVATQIINPQSGSHTNDSSSVVDFYGLDPKETYSAVMYRNVNGTAQDVGGIDRVGSNTIENINHSWGNIKAGAANSALVLTAEADGHSADTAANGIVGTGYNDTFFAMQGNKLYEGGGGTNNVSNFKQWSETGGMDIVDFKLAGNTDLTVNLANKGAQYTGWNTVTLSNIEGIAGAAGRDTFTDNSADNWFEGRGGDDVFNLFNGGHDTLLYKPQGGMAADNRGGNGSDIVHGFTVGAWDSMPNADRIDVSDMLTGYTYGGGAYWVNGTAKMAAGETIGSYLKVVNSGNNTQIYIDRDGNGGAFDSDLLLTLEGVKTDLATLLANHQLDLGGDSTRALSATTAMFNSLTQMFTAGNDIMIGTDQADVLFGGLGDDTFTHIGKGDQVMGGDGNDIIRITSTDFAHISGDDGLDTLILDTRGDLLDLSALKGKLDSVEIFDMGDGGNTMHVSLADVLSLGSEELAIHSGDKAIMINGDAGSTLQLDSADGLWSMSQSHYQYQGNSYNVWTMGSTGIEVLVEDTVQPVIM